MSRRPISARSSTLRGAGGSALLAHVAREDAQAKKAPEDEAASLLRTLEETTDFRVLAWTAAGLSCCFTQSPATMPSSAAAGVAARIRRLEWGPGPPSAPAREAASTLFTTLLDFAREQPEDARLVRSLIMDNPMSESSWLRRAVATMDEGDDCSGYGGSGGAAFTSACHLLAFVTDGDVELAKVLREAGVLDYVATQLLLATSPGGGSGTARVSSAVRWRTVSSSGEHRRGPGPHVLATGGPSHAPPASVAMGTEWHPFACAAVRLIEVLILHDDPDRLALANPSLFKPVWGQGHRPEVVVDGVLAALGRSLLDEGGSMVAHHLHLSGMRALGRIAHFSGDQGRRMLCSNGLASGARALTISGADEEAVVTALWYLAELSYTSQHSHKQLQALGVPEAVRKVQARYPRSDVVRTEASRVLAASRELAPLESVRCLRARG